MTIGPGRATAVGVAITGLGMLPVWLVGALATQLQTDLAFGAAALGVAIAVFQAMAAVTSIPAGVLVERRGWLLGAVVTTVLYVLTTVGIALLTDRFAVLLVWLAIGGVASGFSSPAANLGLVRCVGLRRRALAFGIKQAAVPAGTLVAGLSIPLLALHFGWRPVFAFAAVAGLLTFPLLGLRPRAWIRDDESVHAPDRTPLPRRPRHRARPSPVGPVVLLACGAGFATAATNSIGGFFVASAVSRGTAPGTAGLLLSAGAAVSIVVRVLLGWQASRRAEGHLLIVAAMMAAGAFGVASLGVTPNLGVLLVATILAFGAGWSWNGLFDFALVNTVADTPATATGVGQTGKYIGGLLGPLSFGILAETTSYRTAWFAAAVALLLGAITVLLARRLVRKRQHTGTAAPEPGTPGIEPSAS